MEYRGMSLQRGWLPVVAAVVVTLGAVAVMWGQTPEPMLRLIAFGDNEGVIARPGDELAQKNPALPRLLEILQEEEQKTPIDFVLHTGDLVRFDPSPQLFVQALGPFLGRFYPTTGGDEEFLQGKYWAFIRAVPHLYDLVVKRIGLDHNGFEPYYAVHQKGVHIISLHNPDNYGEPERTPEFAGYDLFRLDHPNRQQYRWLVEQLEEIRQRRGDQSPIIVLSHRPVYNQSRHLVELLDRYRVDLMLSGDFHVYARAQSRHTLHLVTGIVGDRAVGGCDALNNSLADEFLGEFRPCLPGLSTFRKGEFTYHADHYVDISIRGRTLAVKAVELADRQVIDSVTRGGMD
ncbi:MAG TPA: metallophosphoesterase [Candidatus Tectomicrobia bacterium]